MPLADWLPVHRDHLHGCDVQRLELRLDLRAVADGDNDPPVGNQVLLCRRQRLLRRDGLDAFGDVAVIVETEVVDVERGETGRRRLARLETGGPGLRPRMPRPVA